MTAPIRVGEDPLDALIAIKKQRVMSSADPLDELMSSKSKGSDIHEEYKSGRLAKRMQRENTNDREAAEAEDIGYAGRLATHAANLAQGIPGMEAVQAFVGSKVSGKPYRESLDNLRGATDQLPTAVKYAERIAGAAPLASVLPGSAAASGAIVGGADQALSADPDMSAGERAFRTLAGAAGGALIGKGTEKVITGVKALTPAFAGGVSGADANIIARQAARAKSAKALYAAAEAEGKANLATPDIEAFLQEEDIAPIVAKIRGGRTGANLDTYSLLDRIFKELSDQQRQAGKGLLTADPSKPNALVSKLADIKAAKEKLLGVMSKPSEKPPMMMDVAPEVYETAPKFTPGRETLDGPVGGSLQERTSPPNPTLSQALRNFRGNTPNAVQGPAGPQFQLRGQPERVTPGVRIETPKMRVQTAPAEPLPPFAPSYQKAVEDYAQRSREIQNIRRGYEALYKGMGGKLAAPRDLGKKTPLSFAEWAKTAAPEDVEMARQGILGGTKDAFKLGGLTLKEGRKALGAAPSLLRDAAVPSQQYLEILQNLGLLGAGSASSP